MIAGWVVYCVVVSTLIAVLAAGTDELLTKRHRPARWIWLAAIVASLALPASILIVQQRAPAPIAGAGEVRFGGTLDRVSQRERLAEWRANRPLLGRVPRVRTPEWLAGDGVATAAIIVCVLLATVRVAADSFMLFRQRRRWRASVLDGVRVLLSDDQGPALVGLLEPSIVVPEWAASLSDDERVLMLMHEREHLRAADGLLASVGLAGVLCMPWNPAAWYAFRRLRTAIEVDCDRRVLRAFPDVGRYGRLLVDVARRLPNGSSLAITGFSERASPLARRIRAMTADRPRHRRVVARSIDALYGAAWLGAAAGVFVVLPPTAIARQLAPEHSRPALLPKSVGDSIAVLVEDSANGMRRQIRLVARARDLPDHFVVEDPGAGDGIPLPGRCARSLRDPRNGAALQLRHSEGATGAITQRGDTAWARIAATGHYRVTPADMYGLGPDQLLRVGCGAATTTTIVGQPPQSGALSDLESSNDDRARRIGAAIDAALHRKLDEVELYKGRLNVVVTGADADASMSDRRWDETKKVWSAAREVLGRAAMPETLAYSVRARTGGGSTFFYYKAQDR